MVLFRWCANFILLLYFSTLLPSSCSSAQFSSCPHSSLNRTGQNHTPAACDQRVIGRVSTCSKFTEGVVWVARGLLELKKPPGVVHQVLLVLRVHGVDLSVLAALVEQRAQEELGKPTDIMVGQQHHTNL